MLISQKHLHSIISPTLYINADVVLSQVNSVKYLGIQLTTDLSWSTHINNICSKARKLGLMCHQFHLCRPETALKLYIAFIWFHLEYASAVWDTYLIKDIEQVQRIALKNVTGPASTVSC